MTSDPGSIHGSGNSLRTAVLILIAIALIFYLDVVTPLGLSIWILYFIPLFLTLYLDGRSATVGTAGLVIILTYASYFLSPLDITPLFAVLNRIFFTFLITASALLIGNYKQKIGDLRNSEENYRILVEWSPDAIVVCRDRTIRYANQSFLRLFTPEGSDIPAGKDIMEFIRLDSRELVLERIRQAALGAQITVTGIRLVRPGNREITADLTLRAIVWEGSPGIRIAIRQQVP